uniref:Uncharacterized protein n=1 Tax=Anguilla anguilla TaxID=7936 RepID=A0A0E9R2W3_ANGAN
MFAAKLEHIHCARIFCSLPCNFRNHQNYT